MAKKMSAKQKAELEEKEAQAAIAAEHKALDEKSKADAIANHAAVRAEQAKKVREKEQAEAKAARQALANSTKYIGTKTMQWHPFQKVRIPMGSPGAILKMDNWLKCQIEAGLIKEM